MLLADALALSNADDRSELTAMYEAPSRDARQVRRGIEIFTTSGAVELSRERIRKLWAQAGQAIAEAELPQTSRDMLLEACRTFIPDSCL